MPTPQQLAAFINGDPALVVLKNAGNDVGIANVLNGLAPGGPHSVWRPNILASELLGGVVWSEVQAFTAVKWSAITAMLSTGTVDATNPNIRDFFAGVFSGANATVANMTAVAKVPAPSVAEVQWGAGTRISTAEIAVALGRL